MKNQKSWLKILSFLIALITLLIYLISNSPSAKLKIYILDVGQGDAILIKTVDGKYMLVDSGPDEGVIEELQQVIPFWDRTLDLVVLTHPDQDHVGGMSAVFDYYDVKAVSYLPFADGNNAFHELQNDVSTTGIENLKLDDAKDFELGCCTYFDMLWPTKEIYESCDVTGKGNGGSCEYDVNDTSAAFVLIYKDFAMYFGGDLPSEFEEKIFTESSYDLDAIKAGHHGSRTSTSARFLELTKPETAYISVGVDNKFDHPHGETLQNLKDFDVEVYRTDEQGRLVIEY